MVFAKRANRRRGLTGSHSCSVRRQVDEMTRPTPAAPGRGRCWLAGRLVEARCVATANTTSGESGGSCFAADAAVVVDCVLSLLLAAVGSCAVVVEDA
jgi:hypothetical protein